MITEEQIRTMNPAQLMRVMAMQNIDTGLSCVAAECHQAALEEVERTIEKTGTECLHLMSLHSGWLASINAFSATEELEAYLHELKASGIGIDLWQRGAETLIAMSYPTQPPGSLTGGVEILPIESVPPKLPEEKLAEVKFVKAAYTADELAQYAKVAIAPDADEELCGYNWQCCEFDAFILIIGLMLKHGGTFDESVYVGGHDFADAVQVFNDIKEFHDK